MTIQELYASTPVEQHRNIVVARDKVYVRTAEGTDEYAILPYNTLALVRSDLATSSGQALDAIHQDLAVIKAKLGM